MTVSRLYLWALREPQPLILLIHRRRYGVPMIHSYTCTYVEAHGAASPKRYRRVINGGLDWWPTSVLDLLYAYEEHRETPAVYEFCSRCLIHRQPVRELPLPPP